MWWLLAATALGNGWAEQDPTVQAVAKVPASAEAVSDWLSDLQNQERMLAGCTSEWEHRDDGASVRYDIALLHRRLDATLTVHEPGRRVEVDHAGDKGFVTRFLLHEQEGSTRVEMSSYVGAPPWPLRRYYFTRVRPLWAQCYSEGLDVLSEAVLGS